jgi:hypothetical protein
MGVRAAGSITIVVRCISISAEWIHSRSCYKLIAFSLFLRIHHCFFSFSFAHLPNSILSAEASLYLLELHLGIVVVLTASLLHKTSSDPNLLRVCSI